MQSTTYPCIIFSLSRLRFSFDHFTNRFMFHFEKQLLFLNSFWITTIFINLRLLVKFLLELSNFLDCEISFALSLQFFQSLIKLFIILKYSLVRVWLKRFLSSIKCLLIMLILSWESHITLQIVLFGDILISIVKDLDWCKFDA